MKVGRYKIFLVIILLIITQPVCAIEIITSSSVEIEKLTKYELRAVFAGRVRNWPNGLPVRVVVFSDSSNLQVEFCNNYIGLNSMQFRRIWNRVIYSGVGESPFFVKSEAEMIEKIRDIPGSIGYVDEYSQEEGIYVLPIE